jgi:hypothetical protein
MQIKITLRFYFSHVGMATRKNINNKWWGYAGKWMELENIILSEAIQVQKAKSCMFSLICGIRPNTNTAIVWKIGHANGW